MSLTKEQVMEAMLSMGVIAAHANQQAGFDTEKMEFVSKGKQIILPEGMGYDAAIKSLQRKMKEEETLVNISHEIDAYPHDGAWALMNVLKDRYGWASPVPTPGFFMDIPPTMISVEVAPGQFEQAFWGDFQLPGIEGRISTGSMNKNGRIIFRIAGSVKKKHQKEVAAVAEGVKKWLAEHSVYRHQAIRLRTTDDGQLDLNQGPTFVDLSGVKEEELVLPTGVQEAVDTNLFALIEYTDACKANKIPLKRGLLFEGPYGTGKTLCASVAAKKCVKNSWTFIYLDRVTGLKAALEFAQQYAPAVVFAEDIDRAVNGEERTVDIDDVLNTIDGIESKSSNIITVLTSNHVENINRAMLRPGRLDAIVAFQAPDKEAAARLIKLYARDLLKEGESVDEAAAELAGQIPAIIREVVERSKLHAIFRTKGNRFTLIGEDLTHAAKGMKKHIELLSEKKEVVKNAATVLGESMQKVMIESMSHKDSLDWGKVGKEAGHALFKKLANDGYEGVSLQ